MAQTGYPPALRRTLLLAAAAVPALGVTALALLFTGSAVAPPVADPGAFVRWSLPVATMVHHLSMSVVIASLVFLATILPWPSAPTKASKAPPWSAALTRVLSVGTVGSLVWAASAAAMLILSYADTIGVPLSADEAFTRQLAFYMLNIPSGTAWLSTTIIAALVATLFFAVRTRVSFALTGLLAAAAVIPLSGIGHASGGTDHSAGVSALTLHLLGVGLWVGGVIVLGLLSDVLPAGQGSRTSKLTLTVFTRFSTLAAAAFVLVFLSGLVNTALRIGSFPGLLSPYGALIILKTLATLLLGGIGYLHRTRITARGQKNMAWTMIATEAVIMAAVMGLAAVLGRTAPPIPPVPEPDITETEILTGYPLPPQLSVLNVLTQWRWDLAWVSLAALSAGFYLAAIRRAARSGVSWPKRRTLAWCAGLALIAYATSGAPTVYGMVLLSAHLTMLLIMALIVPLLLVIARPVDLVRLSLPRRTDGSAGVREWVERLTARPILTRDTTPMYAGAVLVGSFVLIYGTDLFAVVTANQQVLQSVNAYLLCLGLALYGPLLHHHPNRQHSRPGVLAVLVVLAAVLGASAFLALFPEPVQASWFEATGRTWGPSSVQDQRISAVVVVLLAGAPLLAVLDTLRGRLRNHHNKTGSTTAS